MMALWLGALHGPASAVTLEQLCAPSEATDPQPLHINGSKPFIYKTIGTTELRLHVFSPAGHKPDAKSPAAVFLFGGGWVIGDIRRFQTQATHLALRGLVTVLVDYRVKCRHGTTLMDAVSDAKSAMRWVRSHAGELGIDTARIALVGSSAGGQMAAAAALVPGFDDPTDNKAIDPRPNALVLYNPGLDTGSEQAKATITDLQGKAVADRGFEFSPLHFLDRGLPPTIIFQGTADVLTPIETARAFCTRARSLKYQCEMITYPGAPHGFSEAWMGLDEPALGLQTEIWAWDTLRQTDDFLTRLGWLAPAPRQPY